MNMAKPPRSPLVGYNHNVKYGGHIFHIQTEDSGPGNPHIVTHLFYEGSILGSKRCEYDAADPDDKVRALMQGQHKAILRDLKHQAFDERILRFFASRGHIFETEMPLPDNAPAPAAADAVHLVTPPPGPPPAEIPVTPGPREAALDLDSIPALPPERRPSPEPLPIHLTKPALPGPGIYNFQRPARDERAGEITHAAAPALAPGVASQAPACVPMPAPVVTSTPAPATPAPVVTSTPAPATPAPATASPLPARVATPPPIAPIVVQRQVVVGAGAKPASTARPNAPIRRRPLLGGPFVVKEGSHTSIPPAVASPASPRPSAAAANAGETARTAESQLPEQERSQAPLVTDQSLDDVILAYLAQGEHKH
jgi:hypothetical protein